MNPFATITDISTLWRPLQLSETERAEQLLAIVSDELRLRAAELNVDLDKKAKENMAFRSVLASVVVDVVARTLLASTEQEPMTQFSQAALGYSISGTYLVPGGGVFIKRSELARLGLKRQKIGGIELYDTNKRHPYPFTDEDIEWP